LQVNIDYTDRFNHKYSHWRWRTFIGSRSFVIMILSQISFLDCFAFLIFLAPQLLIHVGIIETVRCIGKVAPFLRKTDD